MANNSVQRLCDFIVRFNQLRSTKVADAFASVLGIQNLDNNYSLFYRRVGVVYALIDSSYKEISKIATSDINTYSEPIKVVSIAMSNLNWGGSVHQSTLANISEADIARLKMTAQRVTDLDIEKEISEEDIEKLLKGVNDLIQEIMELEGLPDDLNSFVLERLDSLRSAIELYRYTGISPIEIATDALVFGVGRHKMFWDSHYQAHNNAIQTLLPKVWTYAATVYTIIGITNNITQFLETAQQYVGKMIGQ